MEVVRPELPLVRNEDQMLYERIVSLIRQEMGFTGRPIATQTSLQQIGLDGAEACTFMSRFAEEFRVDMKNFDFSRHFGREGLWIPDLWKSAVPITISELVEVASRGVWPAPPAPKATDELTLPKPTGNAPASHPD